MTTSAELPLRSLPMGQPVRMERLADTDPELAARLLERLAQTLAESMSDDSATMPGVLTALDLFTEPFHGEPGLSVRISGITMTVAWDGSEQTANEIVENAAWKYAQQERDERWMHG